MRVNELTILAVLIAMGTVLNVTVPGFFFGMKPDMLLVMMFLGIFLFPKTKNILALGVVTGLIAALTTTFPGGQIPNIIDKIITSIVVFNLYKMLNKTSKYKRINALFTTGIGTLASGAVFLSSALFISKLPASFTVLYLTVVLPTAGLNFLLMAFIYPIFQKINKKAAA